MALIHSSIFVLAMPYARNDILSSHFPRVEVDNVSFRVRATPIVVTMTVSQAALKHPIIEMLMAAYDTVQTTQVHQGLGLVAGGEFVQFGAEAVLRMWNANNHQLTWGVVGLVVIGLLDFISTQPNAAAIVFKIFDGANQVGAGQISLVSG